jgi:hypothetical protein
MLFIDNKYTKWYFQIIQSARLNTSEGYTEQHHVIPKCLGGRNNKSNLINLSAKQHFLCHLLLIKMTEGEARKKLTYAAFAMCRRANKSQQRMKITGRTYERLRHQVSNIQHEMSQLRVSCVFCQTEVNMLNFRRWHGNRCPEFTGRTRKGISRPLSDAQKLLLSQIAKIRTKKECEICGIKVDPLNYLNHHGDKCNVVRVHSADTKKQISKSLKGKTKGYKRSNEAKENISRAAKNRLRKECQHCQKIVDASNFSRWHGDNCKQNTA